MSKRGKSKNYKTAQLKRGYTLIIAEKTRAASKIAQALGLRFAGKVYGVPIWRGYFNSRYYVVVPSAGHLFSLKSNEKGYPIFSYEWAPRWLIEKESRHTRRYYMAIKALANSASFFINACDFDIEGSVIGYLIIKMFGDVRKASRVKFSSLTSEELREAFRKSLPSLDWDMIEAGLCRHELDWIWGINVSRALMDIYRLLKGRGLTLSAGRVQSPTLLEVLKRYTERETFVPSIFFKITLYVEIDDRTYKLEQSSLPLRDYEEAKKIADKLKQEKYIKVTDAEEIVKKFNPPPPFNLPDLQAEASRILGLSPSATLRLAENLYLNSLISYPRTNSQKLPPTLDNKKIIRKLGKLAYYSEYVNELLSKESLKPTVGIKEDPAHPAIYPTGYLPRQRLGSREKGLYELIVRRYLACFFDSALVKGVTYKFKFKSIEFVLSGQKIIRSEWLRVYPYVSIKEASVPDLRRGEQVRILRVRVTKTYSRPPSHYSKTALLRWMESVGIGTEATRADIIETLFNRGYLKKSGRAAVVTELGIFTAKVLSKLFSELTSVNLTREFERALELVRLRKISRSDVVNKAKDILKPRLIAVKNTVMSKDQGKLEGLIDGGKMRKCLICNRKCVRSYGTDGMCLCEFHALAYEHILKGYSEWREAIGISFTEYLNELLRIKLSGKFVKEVAKVIITRGELLKDEFRG
ncbi:MAG: DNA topoisomerase I [Desulfurococcales archaeon]|nr:DNA topoisomerase I [Desulfurococcales archaeon]